MDSSTSSTPGTDAIAAKDLSHLRRGVLDWWDQNEHPFPWRQAHDEWKLLLTELLLQRTRASTVAEAFEPFFKRFPTLEALAVAPVSEISEAIYPLGLAWRARFIRQLAEEIVEGGGRLPSSDSELRELPGVGPYAAGAFQVLHRNRPGSFIDANVVRLLGRYFGFSWDGETRRQKWLRNLVDRLFNHKYEPRRFGYALLDFTREVCARSPRCEACPVSRTCEFAEASRHTDEPSPG